MLKKVMGTAGSRVFSALISFVLISINARLLGAAPVGSIALLILGVTLILLVSSLAGGAALVYLTPRHPLLLLLLPASIWAVVSPVLLAPLFGYFGWVPAQLAVDLLWLSILRGLSSNFAMLLLGQERIQTNNLMDVLEIAMLLIVVCCFYFFMNEASLENYIRALYIAYAFSALFGFLAIRSRIALNTFDLNKQLIAFRAIVKHSFYIQFASFFQLLNYRLSYYLLELFSGRAAVGVYAVGTRITESVWVVSKSIGTVQYATIANQKEEATSIQLSLRMFRFSLCIAAFIISALLITPETVYLSIFGSEFAAIRVVLGAMAMGVITLAATMSFSSFFSGIGKQSINMTGSLIGLVLTIGIGLWLVPKYQLMGAAITSCLSYLSTSTYYAICFVRYSKSSWSMLIPRLSDIVVVFKQLKRLLSAKNKK
jgi:O-antigen/teichoic acid export membrane protein